MKITVSAAYQFIDSVDELRLFLITSLFRDDQLPIGGHSALDLQESWDVLVAFGARGNGVGGGDGVDTPNIEEMVGAVVQGHDVSK